MILENYIAVIYKVIYSGERYTELVPVTVWQTLCEQAQAGHIVIIEAWTLGKCISN